MKKEFQEPEVEVIVLMSDVICASDCEPQENETEYFGL